MGARAQVLIEDTGVYLYTHWDSYELPDTVKRALARRDRWDDPEYLARIIFSEMTKDDHDGTTGCGIGTSEHFDLDYRPIVVSCNEGTVTVNGQTARFEEFIG